MLYSLFSLNNKNGKYLEFYFLCNSSACWAWQRKIE